MRNLLLLPGVVFALAAGFAQAQPHGEARHFEGPHVEPRHFEGPHFEPHLRFDDRFHHDRFYPALGFAIATLPLGYLTVHAIGGDYYYHAGVWYRPAGPNFVVVQPSFGAVVPLLPPGYTSLVAGGVPYYYANGVYYAAAPGGYTVVAPPANATAAANAAAGPASPPPGTWYYCDSSKNYYPYVQQCAEGWRSVPATPPNG